MPATSDRFHMSGVSWETYDRVRDDPGLAGLRITFDQGEMEFTSPSYQHESPLNHIRRLVEFLIFELGISSTVAGSTTLKRVDMLRGLEPDAAWYFGSAIRIRGRRKIDLVSGDPPPDLVLEVDMSSDSVAKEPIYAALGVPEIWRYEGDSDKLMVLLLGAGRYRSSARSSVFPFLRPQELVRYAVRMSEEDDVVVLREFQQWVRTTLAPLAARAAAKPASEAALRAGEARSGAKPAVRKTRRKKS